jgi:hypothetical protein
MLNDQGKIAGPSNSLDLEDVFAYIVAENVRKPY